MNRGYTKSWRKKYESRSASRGVVYIGAMDWLVGNANWNDGWHDGIKIERGQLMTGLAELSSVWKVSVRTVRTILSNLEKDGFLTNKSTNRGRIITISNYDIYQPDMDDDRQANRQATDKQPTTIKELEELNIKEKNIIKKEKESNNLLFELSEDKNHDNYTVFGFDEFWNIYGKKVGRAQCEKIYSKIKEKDREKIKATIQEYVRATPDKQYRKNPQTWLNGKCWNDEIITQEERENGKRRSCFGRYTPKN